MAALVQWLYYSGAKDSDGTPIASGSVRFFIPGTSKASSAVAYSDAAGTTPLTQPVALDAAGRAECYLNVQAEIEVKDATGSIRRDSATHQLDYALGVIGAFIDTATGSAPALSGTHLTVATTNPSFQFNPAKTVNEFTASYAGAAGTLAITWPGGSPTLVADTMFVLSISTGTSTALTAITFPSQIGRFTFPALDSNKTYTALFLSVGNNIRQITSWVNN